MGFLNVFLDSIKLSLLVIQVIASACVFKEPLNKFAVSSMGIIPRFLGLGLPIFG